MRKTMLPALAAATLFVATPTFAAAQAAQPQAPSPAAQPAPSPSPTAQTPPSTSAPATEHKTAAKASTAKGELVKVDADAKKLTIKNAEGVETEYAYTATTEVTGGQEGVAGLATKAGTKVTVHFTNDMGTKTATKIEVQGAKDKK